MSDAEELKGQILGSVSWTSEDVVLGARQNSPFIWKELQESTSLREESDLRESNSLNRGVYRGVGGTE